MELAVYCVDIGSVKKGNFAWAFSPHGYQGATNSGADIRKLCSAVVDDILAGRKVALGFECPLFVPVSDNPEDLTRARIGEGNRAWCAGAGAGSLATGLSEVVWILREIRTGIARSASVPGLLCWKKFSLSDKGLFLWEAMVSGGEKGGDHESDATVAVTAFLRAVREDKMESAISETVVHSLIGAALLRTGWREDLSVLKELCLVVRPGTQGSGPDATCLGHCL